MGKSPPVREQALEDLFHRAMRCHQNGQLPEAERLYRQILNTRANHVEARHLFGVLRFQQGRHGEALDLIAAALKAKPDYPEALYNRGNIFSQLGRYDDAIASYEKASALHPGYAEAHHNRGNALFKLKRYEEALLSYDQALVIRPNYAEALGNRGSALMELKRNAEALASFDRALALNPAAPDVLTSRGNVLKILKQYEQASVNYEQALAIDPGNIDAYSGLADTALYLCDWGRVATIARAIPDRVLSRTRSVLPFTLLGYSDDPALQHRCAAGYAKEFAPKMPAPLAVRSKVRRDKIRIAYLSADFHTHATAYLIAELIELHDRSRFDVAGFSFGRDDDSDIRRRLVTAFDEFHDVRAKGDWDVAKLLNDLQIDIAVDLKGYTQESRPEILAFRPAPIQVNYLGYAGTMGADFIDYVVADAIVAPFAAQSFFTERIVHLPDCYQVNDRKRAIADRTPTRQDAGLPADGFVFCCFNNSFKITAPVFDIWMRLLRAVPGSVLWLLPANPGAERNLRREAQARNVDERRIVFAGRLDLDEHLARHRLADLFLDTLPYNAHTTASDALWTGLPVLTCIGKAMAGRVAASLLRAAGLPELVTANLDEYEKMALRLAKDSALLQASRRKLADHRLGCPLFDTDRFRRHIEAAYTTMWETWQRGERPRSFSVDAVGA
jgi:predicted O-linked N-acetylglucosamine transferase (SPINDLY family)